MKNKNSNMNSLLYSKLLSLMDDSNVVTDNMKRRSLILSFGLSVATTFPFQNAVASNASKEQLEKDKVNIVKGYKRLDYLLNNWDKETISCTKSDSQFTGCERSPEKVMEYLGFKSMKDPLFRADKALIRLQALVPPEGNNDAEFQDAVDTWLEKAEEGNGMAFISSWGEANPGGGKDRVNLFIERSKKDVKDARDSLAVVIRILNLKID